MNESGAWWNVGSEWRPESWRGPVCILELWKYGQLLPSRWFIVDTQTYRHLSPKPLESLRSGLQRLLNEAASSCALVGEILISPAAEVMLFLKLFSV